MNHTRVSAKELAELREIVKFGSAIGIGGKCLAALLDEIDHLSNGIRRLQSMCCGNLPGKCNGCRALLALLSDEQKVQP